MASRKLRLSGYEATLVLDIEREIIGFVIFTDEAILQCSSIVIYLGSIACLLTDVKGLVYGSFLRAL
jgi:hypothetical protein